MDRAPATTPPSLQREQLPSGCEVSRRDKLDVKRHPHLGPLARALCVLLGGVLAACKGGSGGSGDRPVPPVKANVASMDAIGDSITTGFNAVSDGEFCPESAIENRNWSTGDTHGGNLCNDGGEGVFSQAERLE